MPEYGYMHLGRIISVEAQGYSCEIITRAPGLRWGPVQSMVAGLTAGERVVLAQLGESVDSLVIVGRLPGRTGQIGDIDGLQAALDAKLDDSQLDQASGVAALDSGRKVAYARLPTGTGAGFITASDDPRLSDARTPLAHHTTHATAGSDPVSPASIGAAASSHTHPESDITSLVADLAAKVDLTSAQTVAGVKTFSSSPVVPAATTSGQAVNKGQLDAVAAAWASYTPTWVMDVANGTKTGAYKIVGGDLCFMRAAIVGTSGVSLGTADITVSLPVPVASIGSMNAEGIGVLINSGGGAHDLRAIAFSGGNALILKYVSSTGNTLGTPGNAGMTFASGDSMEVSMWYPC